MTTQARIARRLRVVTNREKWRIQERGFVFWPLQRWYDLKRPEIVGGVMLWKTIEHDSEAAAREDLASIIHRRCVTARKWVPATAPPEIKEDTWPVGRITAGAGGRTRR